MIGVPVLPRPRVLLDVQVLQIWHVCPQAREAKCMDSGEAKTQEPESGKVFHCARCGESPERTCFIIPEQYSRPPRDVRCITCEQRRLAPTTTRALLLIAASLFWPLWLVVGLAPAEVELGAPP